MSLPSLMVAPNGATKTKTDHPALPITLDEVAETARACMAAGADGLHLHLRDIEGGHLLDSGAYREALEHLARELPAIPVQITTEAGGRYDPGHQKYVALHSGARLVSAMEAVDRVVASVASAAELRAILAAAHAPGPDLDWSELALEAPAAFAADARNLISSAA